MSIGPMGMIGSAAGSHLAQTKGTETDRNRQDAESQQRVSDSTQRAESAAGLGETEQQAEAGERDADGRRLWEDQHHDGKTDVEDGEHQEADQEAPRSLDPTGQRGGTLDLSG